MEASIVWPAAAGRITESEQVITDPAVLPAAIEQLPDFADYAKTTSNPVSFSPLPLGCSFTILRRQTHTYALTSSSGAQPRIHVTHIASWYVILGFNHLL